jgi:hypothetical protein
VPRLPPGQLLPGWVRVDALDLLGVLAVDGTPVRH